MKKIIGWIVSFGMVVGFGVSSASAAGFGLYGSYGSGSATGQIDYLISPTVDFDADTKHQGGGFVLDTAVAKDSLFNYQLNLGYDEFESKVANATEKLKLSGVKVANDFGFAMVRSRQVRLWMGPEIMLAWPNGSINGVRYDLFGYGVGPVLGMNFNIPGTTTFTVKVGYQFMTYNGTVKLPSEVADITMHEKMLYVNIGILFRSSGDFFNSYGSERRFKHLYDD
jgi:hypothetical protein